MDEKRLREIYGPAKEKAAAKILDKLDIHCINFIEKSSFVIVGTLNDQNIDLSPKGDPHGFVKVKNERFLEIPDRPGNNRIDGLLNILKNNFISLLFLIPSVNETLRVQGEAVISEDMDTRERHRLKTNVPKTVLLVKVTQAHLHCGKSMLRAGLWSPEKWPEMRPIPTLFEMIEDQTGIDCEIKEEKAIIAQYKKELY
ncbi:pyridoxamine 5'-phosphate oxidase family protein [Paracoccaceae bacterium]|nr:pyridoxamine 5'-phosphate oxidase family protein [Paracoccaceae bacterium]